MIKLLAFFGIIAAAYGTVSDIEILLILISSIGFLFSAYNLRESWQDWRILKRRGATDHGRMYDPKMVVAWNGLRGEVARLLIQGYFITIGVIAATIAEAPPFIHQPFKLLLFGFVFRWGFIMSSVLLSLKSYWGYQVRHRVLDHYDNAGPQGEKGEKGDPGSSGPQGIQGVQGIQGIEGKKRD